MLLFFFLKNGFGCSECLEIPYEFQNQLVNFSKEVSWEFDEHRVASVYQFVKSCHYKNIKHFVL